MASRTMSGRTQGFGVAEKIIRLKIFVDAGNAPTFTTQGGVTSVVRTAAGKYTITLDDAYYSLVSFQATYVDSGDAVDVYAQPGAVANLGTSTPITAVVKTKTGATNTNPSAAGTDVYISVDLVFEDSAA